jgi:hypothetical protein
MKPFSTIAAAMLFAALPVLAQDTTGTWTPSMQPEVTTEINVISPLGKNKPLNCKRNVIPVKFSVTNTTEELVLVSNTADTDTTNDFSTLSFDPESTLTVADLTNLTAVYDVTAGNCGGGSLRWEIDTTAGNVFVYYGAYPNFDDCNDAATSQSGVNLLTLDDARVDSSQVLAGSQYNTWDAFVAEFGELTVEAVRLVSDGGWSQPDGIQSFEISSATVNDNTFDGTEDAEALCDLPAATIRVTDADGEPVEVQSIQKGDDDTMFTVDDSCQYHFNLVNPGPGTYTVEVIVEGESIATTTFTIACSR